MPKSLDLQQLTINNHPNRRIIHERSRTPDFIPPNPLLQLAQQVVDALMQGFNGWTGNSYSVEDLKALMGVVGAAIAELQIIRVQLGKLEGHVREVLENFLTYAAGALDPDKWRQWQQGDGVGLLGITQNGYANFRPLENARDKIAVAINSVVSGSHQQGVTGVFSMPDNRLDPSLPSKNRLIARADAANPLATHVFADITETAGQIGYVANGVTTLLGTVARPMKSGVTYSLDVTQDRTFRLLENSRVVLEVVDSAAQSVISAATRSSGFGFIAPVNTNRTGFVGSFSTNLRGT